MFFKVPTCAKDHLKIIHVIIELVRRGFIDFVYRIKALEFALK